MSCPEDPWPTLEAAVQEAKVVAEHARSFFGEALESVWIYGSRARGDHGPESDLDLLLVRTLPERPHPIGIEWPFVEHLEENMDGFNLLLTPISIHSVEPERFETWDTMFFRAAARTGSGSCDLS